MDDTPASGINHSYDGEFDYFVGGGVAAFDCDGDGRDDLFLAGGTEPAALFHNDSPVGGALRFSRVPSPATDLTAVTGAYPIDIDSDGKVDLVVLRHGGDVVLRGLGGCRFEDAGQQLGIDLRPGWTTAFSATWEGSNTLPTLAFGRYLVPGEDRCDDSWLLRPDASGSRYAAPIALAPGLLHAVDAVHRLEPHGPPRPSRVERPPLLLDGEEQLWRMAPGQPPTAYTRGRRLAAAADLGDGHRQPGHHGRRPARGVPHEPGRQQAADARQRRGAARLPRHRAEDAA